MRSSKGHRLIYRLGRDHFPFLIFHFSFSNFHISFVIFLISFRGDSCYFVDRLFG